VSLVLNFSHLWCVSLDPAFSFFLSPVCLGPALGKDLIISADTVTNPADVPPSLLSLEPEGALAGSVA
jgi:hypothetical protein